MSVANWRQWVYQLSDRSQEFGYECNNILMKASTVAMSGRSLIKVNI